MAKNIIIKNENHQVSIDVEKEHDFESLYQLGIKLEKAGFVELGYAGKNSQLTPKYLNWAVITRVLKLLDPHFRKIVKTQTTKEVVGEQVIDVTKKYIDGGRNNYLVEVGYEFKDVEYTILHPVMTSTFQDVDVVTGTRLNYAIQRGMVKAVAEGLGLGLHLWTKEEVEQDEVKNVTGAKVEKPKATAIRNAKAATPVKVVTAKTKEQRANEVENTAAKPAVKVIKKATTKAKKIEVKEETPVAKPKAKAKPTVTVKASGTKKAIKVIKGKEEVKEETPITEEDFQERILKLKDNLRKMNKVDKPKVLATMKKILKHFKISKIGEAPRTKETFNYIVTEIKELAKELGLA